MKIKIDFVTNSSTTSFVMLGYVIRDQDDERLDKLQEKAEKLGYQLFIGMESGAPDDNSALVGEIIGEASNEDCGFEEKEVDLTELVEKVNQLKIDLGLPANLKPKVICTTRAS